MSIRLSLNNARTMVLENLQQRQLAASKAGRQIKTFWGYWNKKAVMLSIGEAITEVQQGSELGQFIVAVTVNGISQQTGQQYVIEG